MKPDIFLLLVFLFLVAGIVLVSDISLIKKEKEINISFKETMAKSKRGKINAFITLSRYDLLILKIDALLLKINKKRGYLYLLMIICFSCGITVGYICFQGVFLSFTAGIIFLPLFYLYLLFQAQGATRKELEELENTMSIITNAYMGNDDIVRSVEVFVREKNKYEDNQIKITPFDEFISDIIMINPNVERGLAILAGKIDNKHFYEWVKVLVLCSQDRRLKFALQPVVDAMNDEKLMQIESDTQMTLAWRNYLITVIVMFSIIPSLRIAQESWYLILTQTLIGKVFIFLMMLTSLVTGAYVMKINKPINTI